MWSIKEITEATGGTAYGTIGRISSVGIDSRNLAPGGLFVAFKGERVDGHDYVKAALAKGASAALVERIPEGMGKDSPVVLVEDVYKALVALAVASRKRTRAKIIAVTGSVGKTGTKEAIRTALSGNRIYATQGNFNNHLGLPLSLANLPAEADFGVFELGMNHTGEISYLTNILRPDIAVITNVEAVHLEFFKNLAEIADAKAEVMEGLAKDGTIVLNRDSGFYERLLKKAYERGIRNVITFGEHVEADCRLISYALQDFGSQIEANIKGTHITYRLGAVGRHWATTSLATLAAITAAGVYLADAAAALANFHEPEGRGKIQLITLGKTRITLIDDCYNASPVSMNSSLAKLAELHAATGSKGRKIAVLGDMLELGESAPELHKGLVASLTQNNIDKLYAAGTLMKHLYDILPAEMQGAYAMNSSDLAAKLIPQLKDNDIVLIKGSHGSRMDIIRDIITNKKELVDAV